MDESSGNDGTDLGGDLGHLETRDESSQVVGMCPDVPHHQRRATPHRVVSPRKPAGRIWIVLARLSTLDVFDLNEPDLPQLAVGDHGFRLADQRVPGVVVG